MTNKGSTWNIWDFHVHSPCSVLKNEFGDASQKSTWDRYFQKLDTITKDKGIAAIGITDYFSIDGYKRVIAQREAERREAQKNNSNNYFLKNIFVFPNAEFRLLPATSHKRPINIHLLFSPEIVDELDDKFFSQLTFHNSHATFSCIRSELIRLGKQHKDSDSLTDDNAYKIGINQFKTTVKDLEEALNANVHIRKNTIVVVSNSSNDGVSGLQQDESLEATRNQFYCFADAIFSANPRDREYFLGEKTLTPKEIIKRYKALKPCIHGSDAHELDKIGFPDEKRYCWVKSEVTWEGLRQILYEPRDRVKIQENNPEPDKSIYTIDQINIPATQVNDSLSIAPFYINTNRNLVAIIGGRGSGKTALLDLIASCFKEGNKLFEKEHSYSFIYRLYSAGPHPPKKKPSTTRPININLKFKSSEDFSKNVGESNETFNKADVIYLTQNHFDEYSANPNALYYHIIELVFGNYSEEKLKYQEAQEAIGELEKQLQSINLDIEQLRADVTGKKEIEDDNLKQKKGEKIDYEQRIAKKTEGQNNKDEVIRTLSERLNNLKSQNRSAVNTLDELEQLKNFISSTQSTYSRYATDINNKLALFSSEFVSSMPDTLSGLLEIEDVIAENKISLESIIRNNANKIEELDKQIGALEGADKEVAELLQKLENINIEIGNINDHIQEIVKKQELLVSLEADRISIYTSMVKQTAKLRGFLQAIIEKFEIGKDEMLRKLKFTAVVNAYETKEYLDRITEKVDNRSNLPILQADFPPIFDSLNTGLNTDEINFDFSIISKGLHDLAYRLVRKKNTSESELCNLLFSKFFQIGLQIEFNNKPIGELSMGERAVVLLKILLSLDDKPLLIDQPEEHLDNRYIYTELMPAFRNAKTKRQIIIATHNANLVVNTDAEQVIVADYSNGKLSYTVGTLENTDIRESIKNILEGGDEAFKKREEKYGYRL